MTAVIAGVNHIPRLDAHPPLPPSPSTPSTIGTLPDRYIPPSPQFEEVGNSSNIIYKDKRSCAFCTTTSSPTWKKGPGKGYLCTLCATNWLNRQHVVAQAKAKNEYKKVMSTSSGVAVAGVSTSSTKKDKDRADKQVVEYDDDYYDDLHDKDRVGENNYYCRYCDTTWPLNYFRNRQQFGAHCSNCSRKRKPRGT